MQKEEYIVTARKWRPLRFDEIVGQNHITQTIKNAIKANRIHHAYLFSGPRGIGKTTTARILSRALNCKNPQNCEPCNECESCLSVVSGRSIDIIEIDGASNNSVDDVRKLRENSKYPPSYGKYKMYIIDEVHMLSNSAFNALLKTLEEPPPHLMFVFATTESHKVPATILSRCQRFEFRRMSIEDVVKQLSHIAEQEGIVIDEESLIAIAQKADGSMRDGQSIFDQVVAFCGKTITYTNMADALRLIDQNFYFRISTAILENNTHEAFLIVKDVVERGYDIGECLGGMLEHFRNMMAIKFSGDSSLLETSSSFVEKYIHESGNFTKGDLLRCMNIIANTEQSLRFASQPRVRFELALVKMTSMDSTVQIDSLIKDIKSIASGTTIQVQSTKEEQPEPATQKIEKPKPPKIIDTNRNTLMSNWDKFLDHYIDKEKFLQSLQSKKIFQPKFSDGEIIFETTSDFHKQNIERKKDNIELLLLEYFKGKITVQFNLIPDKETLKQTSEPVQPYSAGKNNFAPKSPVSNKDFESQSSNNKEKNDDGERHPLDQKVIELFDARESL